MIRVDILLLNYCVLISVIISCVYFYVCVFASLVLALKCLNCIYMFSNIYYKGKKVKNQSETDVKVTSVWFLPVWLRPLVPQYSVEILQADLSFCRASLWWRLPVLYTQDLSPVKANMLTVFKIIFFSSFIFKRQERKNYKLKK